MAEKRTRRRFAAEFKAQAVQRLLEDGKGLSEAATELGLSPGQLSLWRNEHLAAGSAEALALRKAEQAEVQRLKREDKRLEEEVEIRKKAAALPPSLEPVALGGKFAPGGSRDQVRLRGGRAGEPCRGHAVPDHRRERVRLLRLAARDPRSSGPGRGGSRVARPYRPDLHCPTPSLWRATELRREGRRHARRRVARLMREMGLAARRGRRRAPRTTDSRHDIPVAPNLLDRNFAAERPDTVWLADISYLPTGEGWLYLAVIEDMASREIVGWSMADHLRAELCIDALVMALQRCRPEPGLILHSDRGVQYASNPYREVLERHGIRQSMSRRGNCLDNAPMESFFASLKKEHVHQARFRTREEAKAAVFEYVEIFYNRQRLHSALGYRTPVETRLRMEGMAIRAAA